MAEMMAQQIDPLDSSLSQFETILHQLLQESCNPETGESYRTQEELEALCSILSYTRALLS